MPAFICLLVCVSRLFRRGGRDSPHCAHFFFVSRHFWHRVSDIGKSSFSRGKLNAREVKRLQ